MPTTSPSDEGLILGVSTRPARSLGIEVNLVRSCFAVLVIAAGWGIALYLGLFILLYRRSLPRREVSLRHNLGAVAATGAQLAFLSGQVEGLPMGLAWPALLISSALTMTSVATRKEVPLARATGRVVAGVLLMGAGLVSAIAGTEDVASLWYTGVAVLVLVGGLGLVLAPWYQRTMMVSENDRHSRIRAEERADVAAHLHDSVLQTLTLIQNRAAEPEIAAALAHQQERELRRWLYQPEEVDSTAPPSFRQLLENEAARIEDQYHKIIECIVVGDLPTTPILQAVIGAAGEAMVNAAKFAEVPLISVFAEVEEQSVLVFVRDRGVGFALAEVPSDRHGVTDSIQGRIERLGGLVAIKSMAGQGTEVRIELPL